MTINKLIGIVLCVLAVGSVFFIVNIKNLNIQTLVSGATVAVEWLDRIGGGIQERIAQTIQLPQWLSGMTTYKTIYLSQEVATTSIEYQTQVKSADKATSSGSRPGPTTLQAQDKTTKANAVSKSISQPVSASPRNNIDSKPSSQAQSNSVNMPAAACSYNLAQAECNKFGGTIKCSKVYDSSQPSGYSAIDSCKCVCPKLAAGSCFREGAMLNGGSCCAGLVAVDVSIAANSDGTCDLSNKYILGQYFVCIKCGDGICNATARENKCNCSQDCN